MTKSTSPDLQEIIGSVTKLRSDVQEARDAESPWDRLDDARDLEATNRELRAKVAQLRKKRKVTGFAGFGANILTGRELRSSIRSWLSAKNTRDEFPIDETADVLFSIIRRLGRIGIFFLVLFVIPMLLMARLMLWQNFLYRQQSSLTQMQLEMQRDQVEMRRAQVEMQRAQLEEQVADQQIVRRAQLIGAIYEVECRGGTEDDCLPKAHPRVRREAVLSYSAIERARGSRIDLRSADLRGLDLAEANLRGADLTGARLSGTDLSRADLGRATLVRADISEANLAEANLAGANFFGASLRHSNLSASILTAAILLESDLSRANLAGADLRNVDLGSGDSLEVAFGDAITKLPEGVERPKQWQAAIYRTACGSGEAIACSNLATLYLEGEGVTMDLAQAAQLFLLACQGGVDAGCESLKEICEQATYPECGELKEEGK